MWVSRQLFPWGLWCSKHFQLNLLPTLCFSACSAACPSVCSFLECSVWLCSKLYKDIFEGVCSYSPPLSFACFFFGCCGLKDGWSCADLPFWVRNKWHMGGSEKNCPITFLPRLAQLSCMGKDGQCFSMKQSSFVLHPGSAMRSEPGEKFTHLYYFRISHALSSLGPSGNRNNKQTNLNYLHKLLWILASSWHCQSGKEATSGAGCWRSDQGRLCLLNYQERKQRNNNNNIKSSQWHPI